MKLGEKQVLTVVKIVDFGVYLGNDEERVLRLLEQASTILPKDRLLLSHQCGFASCDSGNELAIPQQWAKIKQGQEIAKKFWD